jgi:four helix bundle protein
MTVSNFEDLTIWQLARALSKEIYLITDKTEFQRDIRFSSQIRAAVGSIMDNIAEGFSREGKKEFVQFLYIAKGSCAEVQSQLYRSYDVGYVTQTEFANLLKGAKDLEVKITNMIVYLKQTKIEGHKYKD